MKTVAFDCDGTLLAGGERGECVRALYHWFESKGCKMIIWSSWYSYTTEAKEKFNLNGECWSKRDRESDPEFHEMNPDYNVDIAVDDRDWIETSDGETIPLLACNHMIKVNKISTSDTFEERYGHLLND
jgi:hypothetical protein